MTYNGPIAVEINLGDIVRIHPDTRGTFLPVLRDEECHVTNLVNRGTRKRPQWDAHLQAVDERVGSDGKAFRADRWVGVADLEIVQRAPRALARRVGGAS